MFNWLRRLVLRFLEWLASESLPEITARVREKRQKEVDRRATLASKKYIRTFTFGDGSARTVTGNVETICLCTDAWAEKVYGSPPVATSERMEIQ